MPFFTWARWFRSLSQPRNRPFRQRKRDALRLHMEVLEERTLMSTLPAALVSNQTAVGPGINPQVAIDPLNSQKMVVVASTGALLTAYYSTDAGTTWNPFLNTPNPLPAPNPPIVNVFPTLDDPNLNVPAANGTYPKPPNLFAQVNTPSITFDRTESFYVAEMETDGTSTSGALVLQKYDMSGTGAPVQTIKNQVLYSWLNQDPIYNPVIAVDNNVPSYTDPQTGAVQTDTLAALVTDPRANTAVNPSGLVPKGVYLAWNTAVTVPTNPPNNFQPNAIQVMVSPDGGGDWTNPEFVSANGFTGTAGSSPQIAFTQGNSLSTPVPGGQLIFAWDKLGANQTIELNKSLPDGGVAANAAASATTYDGLGGAIAQPPPAPSAPISNVFPITVTSSAVVTFSGSGAVTLSYQGTQGTPSPFIYTAGSTTAASFQTYVNSIPALAGVTVTGGPGGPFTLKFPGGTFPGLLSVVSGPATIKLPNTNLDPNIGVLDTVTVGLSIQDQHIGFLNITLTSPTGTTFTLVRNSINNAGTVIANQGVTDAANMGVINSVANTPGAAYSVFTDPNANSTEKSGPGVATVFDDRAARRINDATATVPYVGHFKPELGSLDLTFGGLSCANMLGTWTLTVTDVANDATAPAPARFLAGWTLNFTGRTVGYGNFTAAPSFGAGFGRPARRSETGRRRSQ